eukprot:CAMPEP_0119342838 /NCGR_PEP_ID=MMETSP1333-20130426/105548_1 /TAXON_ID=418940 /ORGANISM="Scyphosphaera apsteinii, Strain RCC1455" /LENGTH=282 /DNA_ID=CAMNT_0007355133 /DNA_START=534 /DNA_END=1382 /DNA_ORIENTATION=-
MPKIVEAPSRRSQFEHFAQLWRCVEADMKNGSASNSTFCLFSDDDDVSAPGRTEAYANVLGRSDLPPVACCTTAAMREQNASAHELVLRNADAIDEALACGVCVVQQVAEFWQYAVRADVLSQFFAGHSDRLLAHKLADLRFRQWLHATRERHKAPSFSPREWLYFYDRNSLHHSHAHVGPPRQVDMERAERFRVDSRSVRLMRDVGEMGVVIGFDGPLLGHALPARDRKKAALDLLLDTLTQPQDLWSAMTAAQRETWRTIADEMADELIEMADQIACLKP